MSVDSEAGGEAVPLVCLGVAEPYRQAVYAGLDQTRFEPVAAENPEQWALNNDEFKMVVIQPTEPGDWLVIEKLSGLPQALVVVLTPDLSTEQFAHALALGCDGVVYADTTVEIIVSVIKAAWRGEVVLPVQAAQLMAKAMRQETYDVPPLTSDEKQLLGELAVGCTVVELARQVGWSDRTLRRRLQTVYIKLGVANRAQAIAKASKYGILE